MNISQNKYDAIESIIYTEGLRITSLEISPGSDKLYIHLNTNLTFVIPARKFKGFKNADIKSIKKYRLIGKGIGIHWPDLDEDLSLKGFLKEFLSQKVKSRRRMVIA